MQWKMPQHAHRLNVIRSSSFIPAAGELLLVTLYEYTTQPRYWVAHDEDGYWLVPARDNGWAERAPFVGHVIALRRLVDTEGIDIGIPGGIAP